jgi:hypothetical protein
MWLGNCLPNGKTIKQVTARISEIKSTTNDISNTEHLKLFLFLCHIKIFFLPKKKIYQTNTQRILICVLIRAIKHTPIGLFDNRANCG